MLSTAEQQALDDIGEQLTRDNPELARLLSPGRPQAPVREEREGWPWLSWVVIYVMLMPWIVMLMVVEPGAAYVLVILPAAFGLLARGRRLYRQWRRSRS